MNRNDANHPKYVCMIRFSSVLKLMTSAPKRWHTGQRIRTQQNMPNIREWLTEQWQQTKQRWLPDKEENSVALDQVSRFYQSDFYTSLDDGLKSAFYDGPLGGLDSRIIERTELDFLLDCYRLWQSGRNVSCGIYGEKGTGLSTLLNMFSNQLKKQDQAFKLLSLEKRLSSEQDVISAIGLLLAIEPKEYKLDEFINALNALPARVIILDNIHFLVQRTIDAQIVIDTLSAIILASRGHHFWVLAGEEQAWRRLCYGYQFENLFSHQQQIPNFNERQIRDLLIKRFSYGGFHTINDISIDELAQEKSPVNEVAKRSKGCVELGIFYCLNNLTYGTKPQSIYIMSPQEVDMAPLKKLTQAELFSLAEISTHGQLSIKEHHKIFRISLNESKMILEHLRVLGLLDKNEEVTRSDAYSLKLIISAVVIRYLISMNYLY